MIPTSGPFTSEDIATEWGLATPYTSEQIAAAVGLGVPWSTDDLRGRASQMVVTVSTTFVEGETVTSSPSNVSVTSSPVVATVTGGKLPRTLAWERVTGAVFVIDTPAQPQTTFSGLYNSYGVRQGTYRLKATDNAGVIAYGPEVAATLTVTNASS